MGQSGENFVNVHHEGFFFGAVGKELSGVDSSCFSSAMMRERMRCSWRKVAAFFSQAALSSKGKLPLYTPGSEIDLVTTVATEI